MIVGPEGGFDDAERCAHPRPAPRRPRLARAARPARRHGGGRCAGPRPGGSRRLALRPRGRPTAGPCGRPEMTASVIGLAAGGREGRFGNGSKSRLVEGRGTPKRSILILCESLSASPQLRTCASRVQALTPDTFGGFGSPRPRTPALAHRLPVFAVSAPHLGLTLDLPELCRSTERRASGEHACHAGATAPAPVRPPEPPGRVAEPQAPVPAPHSRRLVNAPLADRTAAHPRTELGIL